MLPAAARVRGLRGLKSDEHGAASASRRVRGIEGNEPEGQGAFKALARLPPCRSRADTRGRSVDRFGEVGARNEPSSGSGLPRCSSSIRAGTGSHPRLRVRQRHRCGLELRVEDGHEPLLPSVSSRPEKTGTTVPPCSQRCGGKLDGRPALRRVRADAKARPDAGRSPRSGIRERAEAPRGRGAPRRSGAGE